MERSETGWEDELPAVLRSLQIVVGALVLGCVFFLGVALLVASQGGAMAGGGQMGLPTQIAVALAIGALVARAVVTRLMVARGRGTIAQLPSEQPQSRLVQDGARSQERIEQARKLWAVFSARTIAGAAIVEGAAFFALVAYLVGGHPVSLLVAILLILALAAQLPTRSGLILWTEDQLRLLEAERQLRPD